MSPSDTYKFFYGDELSASQSVENEIDIFLEPNQAEFQVAYHTYAGLMIGKAIERFNRCHMDSCYFAFYADHSDPDDDPLLQSLKETYRSLCHFRFISEETDKSETFYEVTSIPFPILQGLGARLALLARDRLKIADFGIEASDSGPIVWFVAHGVGKFAVNLQRLSVRTAGALGLLIDPVLYEAENEKDILAELGVYPLFDVLWNRHLQSKKATNMVFSLLPTAPIRVNYYGRNLCEDFDMLIASAVCS